MNVEETLDLFLIACKGLENGNAQESLININRILDDDFCIDNCMNIIVSNSLLDASLQFQIFVTFKRKISSSWWVLTHSKKIEIVGFLTNLLCSSGSSMKNHVLYQLLECVCIAFKYEYAHPERSLEADRYIMETFRLLSSEASNALPLLKFAHVLVGEFSMKRPSAFGLSWEYHFKCLEEFEEKLLNSIFHIAFSTISSISKFNEAKFALICIIEILNWPFRGSKELSVSSIGFNFKEENIVNADSFHPPKSWEADLVNSSFLELVGEMSLVDDTAITRECLDVVVLLSKMHVDIFSSPEIRMQYMERIISVAFGVISKKQNVEVILFASQILANVASHFSEDLASHPENALFFFRKIEELAKNVIQKIFSRQYEAVLLTWCDEALEYLLEIFQIVFSSEKGLFQQIEGEMIELLGSLVEFYIHSSFKYNETLPQEADGFESDIESDDDERERNFLSHIESVSTLGRRCPERTLRVITIYFKEIMEMYSAALYENAANPVLQENVYSLLLSGGYLLADGYESEMNGVPPQLLQYSMSIAQFNDGEGDMLMNLLSAIFGFVSLENSARKTFKENIISISELNEKTLLWFLRRIVVAYLFSDESGNSSPIPSFSSEGLMRFIELLLEKVFLCLEYADLSVKKEAVRVLLSLSKRRECAKFVVSNDQISSSLFSFLQGVILARRTQLNVKVLKGYVRGIVRIFSYAGGDKLKIALGYLKTLESDYMISRSEEHLCIFINFLRGVALGGVIAVQDIFSFLKPYFQHIEQAISGPKYDLVISDILKLICDLNENIIPFTDCYDTEIYLKLSLDILQNVIFHYESSLGGTTTTESDSETDLVHALKILSKTLQVILSKLLYDFHGDENMAEVEAEVAKSYIYGLRMLLTATKSSFLSYSSFFTEYYHLLFEFIGKSPEIFLQLDTQLVTSAIGHVVLGISSYVNSISISSLGCLVGFLKHYIRSFSFAEAVDQSSTSSWNRLLLEYPSIFADILTQTISFAISGNDITSSHLKPLAEMFVLTNTILGADFPSMVEAVVERHSLEAEKSNTEGLFTLANQINPDMDDPIKFKEFVKEVDNWIRIMRSKLRFLEIGK